MNSTVQRMMSSLLVRLNIWQKIGIVFSILWALSAAINTHNSDMSAANHYAEWAYNICANGKAINHQTDLSGCDKERIENFQSRIKGSNENAAFAALAPIPFAWLGVFILFYVMRAQIVGFRSVIPWRALDKWKKGFVVFCVLVTTFIAIFGLMFILNMYVDTKVPVSIAGFNDVSQNGNNIVYAEGTWTRTDLTDDMIMNPLQTSKIECIREDNRCYQTTASVSDNVLMTDLTIYDVESWTQDAVIFRDDSFCSNEVFTIDLNTKTVSGAGHDVNADDPACKSSLPSTSSHDHWSYLLTNGFNVYWKLRMDARPYLLRVIQSWFGH